MRRFNDKKSTVRAVALRRCSVMEKLSSKGNAGVVGSAEVALSGRTHSTSTCVNVSGSSAGLSRAIRWGSLLFRAVTASRPSDVSSNIGCSVLHRTIQSSRPVVTCSSMERSSTNAEASLPWWILSASRSFTELPRWPKDQLTYTRSVPP